MRLCSILLVLYKEICEETDKMFCTIVPIEFGEILNHESNVKLMDCLAVNNVLHYSQICELAINVTRHECEQRLERFKNSYRES